MALRSPFLIPLWQNQPNNHDGWVGVGVSIMKPHRVCIEYELQLLGFWISRCRVQVMIGRHR